MTKKQTIQWLAEEGFTSQYSGRTRTLYVNEISQLRLDSFGLSVAFNIKAN